MRFKLSIIISTIAALCASAMAQTPVDTVYNPAIIYSGMPPTYEIADIKVNGADNYEDFVIIGYSGLKAGERIEIPGSEITSASKRLWRQGLFSKVQIAVDKIAGDKAWLSINVRQQPQVSAINYNGVKKVRRMTFRKNCSFM